MTSLQCIENENPEQSSAEGNIFENLSKHAVDAYSSYRTLYGEELLLLLNQQPLEEILNHIHDIVSSLLIVSEDETPIVRQNLVEQIPACFLRCHEHACPDLEYYLYDRLLQVLLQYLADVAVEVRREAFTALTTLLEKYLIDKKRIEEQVCPAIVNLSKKVLDNNQSELQLRAISLMKRTAVIIGPEKSQEIFLEPFIELCSCRNNCVRRACTVLFATFIQLMGEEISDEVLLPTFFKLCEDENWGVRRACAETIPIIALVCSLKCRREKITPVVLKLIDDPNRWVVCAILKVLGQLIPSFADPCIIGVRYVSGGDLQITNPVDPDFRDHPDPEILANYEHFMNTFVETSTPTGKQSFEKDKEELYSDMSCEEIAQILFDTKHKLYVQITAGERVSMSNVMNLKTLIDSPGETIFSATFTEGKSGAGSVDEFYSLFFNMPSAFGSDDYSSQNFNSSFRMDNSDDGNMRTNENCNDQSFDINLSSHQNSLQDCVGHHQETPQSNSSDFNDRKMIPSHNHIPPFRPREHFRRKNTPADLSSIIKQAIDEGQERNKHIPPPLSIPKSVKSDLKVSVPVPPLALNDIPLETPSIENSPKTLNFSNTNSTILSNSSSTTQQTESDNKTFVSDFTLNPKEICDIGPVSLNNNSANTVITTSCTENRAKEQNELSQICIKTNNDNDDYDNDGSKLNVLSNNVNITNKTNDNHHDEDESEDDAFNEYNSHRFWYISPELPLDIDLVSSYGSTSTRNEEIDDGIDIKLENSLLNTMKMFDPPTDFTQNVVPLGILEGFVKMVLFKDEPDMNLNCAIYFPAVALTIGRENWHIIKSLLTHLCDDLDYKVRKTIASAIDVLAMILGRELATKDLIPIYLGFFKDLEEVKIEAIRNFANFLNVIDPEMHEKILSSVGFCLRVDSVRHWRVKEDMAKQVVILIQMYESLEKYDCLLYLTSLAGILLEDPVSCVREIAAEAMASIIRISSRKQREAIIRHFLVKEFSMSDSWRKRQTFLNVFYILSKSHQLDENLLQMIAPEIARLSLDGVPNIRILAARFLTQLIKTQPFVWESDNSDHKELIKVIYRLKNDEDSDVKDILNEI